VHPALYRLINLLHTTARDNEVEQVLRDASDAGLTAGGETSPAW